ncbi:DUF2513 domain-containing protein [Celeribacter sp.]|uniref:DUF2513 domain-containing protein n=1 Tax=Celeribacter sp. TaxID=1890673 RepID=UPI003A93C541
MAKRNLDRMREILCFIEDDNDVHGRAILAGNAFFNAEDSYQIQLLQQAGFIQVGPISMGSGMPSWGSVTFEGHDYLDAIRDEGIWSKTKNAVAETGGSASIEIVKALAVGFLKKKISQHTGMEL